MTVLTLEGLRKTCERSLEEVAGRMGRTTEFVEKIENGEDERASSIGSYIEALGGECVVDISFEGEPSMQIPLKILAAAASKNP